MDSALRVELARQDPDLAAIESLVHRMTPGLEVGVLPVVALKGRAVLRLFVDAGWNLEDRDEGRFTALMVAAEVGDVSAVALLLEAGASPNSINMFGQTALHRAACSGRDGLEVARLLLEAGGDANAKDAEGNTPHDLARRIRVRFGVSRLGVTIAASTATPGETELSKLIGAYAKK